MEVDSLNQDYDRDKKRDKVTIPIIPIGGNSKDKRNSAKRIIPLAEGKEINRDPVSSGERNQERPSVCQVDLDRTRVIHHPSLNTRLTDSEAVL